MLTEAFAPFEYVLVSSNDGEIATLADYRRIIKLCAKIRDEISTEKMFPTEVDIYEARSSMTSS
jgi:hypothetical protein